MREEVSERKRQELVDRVLQWRVATIGTFIAVVPAILVGDWLAGRTGQAIAVVGCLVPCFVAWAILGNMECPNCKDRLFFASKGWGGRNPFASKCLNCGLSLSMDSPKAASAGANVGKNNGAA